ncbi:MAG: hypothetical protein MUD01_24365 [Chloroflexaceae bacterium]|nr:hypothetical protein [Chloroflexaceae bacterium]
MQITEQERIKLKLDEGLRLVSKARRDRDYAWGALSCLHGALEDHIRLFLSQHPALPATERALALDRQQVRWPQLLAWLHTYAGYPAQTCDYVEAWNKKRNWVNNGGTFVEPVYALEQYADFVATTLGYRRTGWLFWPIFGFLPGCATTLAVLFVVVSFLSVVGDLTGQRTEVPTTVLLVLAIPLAWWARRRAFLTRRHQWLIRPATCTLVVATISVVFIFIMSLLFFIIYMVATYSGMQ